MTTTGDTRQAPGTDDHARLRGDLDAVLAGEGVREVCAEHDLARTLASSVNLIRSTCGPIQSLTAEVDLDPDTDERRVMLDVDIDAGVDEVLRQYARFTRTWVEAEPLSAREWVRFAFHPLRD